MLTLLSTLISFLMGGLPKILDFFQDKADKLHELQLARLQIERELEMRKLDMKRKNAWNISVVNNWQPNPRQTLRKP